MVRETKSITFFVRMTPTGREKVSRLSADYDMTESEFVRAFVDYVDSHRPQLIITPESKQP